MPVNSIIIGVDLSPIKPIPKVITFQSDITTEKCRATIRQHLKTWKADTVLHDGAPNVGTAWVQDSFNQAELVLQAMRLATDFLIEGGTFVTKVFRSKDYNSLLWVFNQLFTKVEATKPPSSRNVSAEIFVVCRGFKAPKKIDPRFLDPRAVFAELADPAPNNEAKVYNPDIKKRKRGGYEDNEMTQFKELPASEFINTTDPIAILGQYNKLTLEQASNGDVALAALNKLPETTDEIRLCCNDLKVLGRKEFKLLLRWRLKVREIFGFPSKKTAKASLMEEAEEVAETEPMDEELRIQQDLQALKDKENGKKKREKRRANEQKQKEIIRMQLNMTAPMDIGMEEAGPMGEGAMFALKTLDQSDAVRKIAKGKMAVIKENEAKKDHDSGLGSSAGTDDESDEEEDRLERELDSMYDQYRERKGERDAKYRAKRARQEHEDGEWEGVSADEKGVSDDEMLEEDSDEDEDDEEEDTSSKQPLLRDLDGVAAGPDGLSKRATRFFSQDIFKDVAELLDEEEEEENKEHSDQEMEAAQGDDADTMETDAVEVNDQEGSTSDDEVPSPKVAKQKKQKTAASDSDDDFEIVRNDDDDDESDWEVEEKRRKDPRPGKSHNFTKATRPLQRLTSCPDIDIITAEAMTLAHELATGKKSSHDLIDDGFNKHALKDRDGLPDWFIEDESKHDRPQRPITKEAARAIQEKTRALNARPIKKVREAKARKKFHAAQRLEKLKKKSDLLANEEGMTEKEKASSISKLMAKASKQKPRKPLRVVVAKGSNRGLSGRPKGVKGRYKMVDPRMRKDMRALKRVASKKKK
jgi:AdoMet-dependent rRNA methyltransferase SPB1